MIDTTATSNGYVTVSYESDKACKARVKFGDKYQNFSIPNDGTPKVLPLCSGNGAYSIILYRHQTGTTYLPVFSKYVQVALSSPFAPYLHTNTYCEYTKDSLCYKIAQTITANAHSDMEMFSRIYWWIINNIEYDKDLAERVQAETWWLPYPDDVVNTHKSICWGYTSLCAAMCRAVAIPCKMCVGTPKDSGRHAWTEVYLNTGGEIQGIRYMPNAYSRTDLTWMDSSNGNKYVAEFIMDDSNFENIDYLG